MPALNFHERFVEAVESGRKRQTIRAPWRDGRFPFRPSDRLYLYTGLRTPAARKLGDAKIVRVAKIRIEEQPSIFPYARVIINGERIPDPEIDALAQDDGFRDFDEMMWWWRTNHQLPFEGFIVYWEPLGGIR